MPRVSIRSITRALIGLTTDMPSDTQPLADEIQLVERLGDSKHDIQPAVRPRMGGAEDQFTAAAATFGVVQLRAGSRPLWVLRHISSSPSTTFRVGADLITAQRVASNGVWQHPAGGTAIVEHGATAAAVVPRQVIIQNVPNLMEYFLEPGEVLSYHCFLAATLVNGRFNWREVP